MAPKRFLMYDGALSEAERAALEGYLRRRCLASFDLESPQAVPETGKTVRPR